MKELEKKEMRIILASASPRRRELLSQLGVEFEVCPSHGEKKKITEHLPELAVMQLAQQKAADIAGKTEGDAWILGADTIVVYDQKILGKPKDEEDAKRMLGHASESSSSGIHRCMHLEKRKWQRRNPLLLRKNGCGFFIR